MRLIAEPDVEHNPDIIINCVEGGRVKYSRDNSYDSKMSLVIRLFHTIDCPNNIQEMFLV